MRLGTVLLARGCSVDVVTTFEKGAWFDEIGRRGLGAVHIAGHGRRPHRIHAFKVGRRLAHNRYDVVFLNNAAYGQASIPLLGDAPVVIPILHGTLPFVFNLAARNQPAWNVAVAVGPSVAALAREKIARPIVTIPTGVELPEPEQWRRRVPHGRPFRLVFVGRVEESKGVQHLAPILESCRRTGLDVELDVIGGGAAENALREHCADAGLADRVRFHGTVAPAEVYRHLLEAHAMILPSYSEGLPVSTLEAQACGCVPIATRLAGVTDYAILDGQSGLLIELKDEAAIARAVASLYHDAETWTRMSAAGHDRIAREFSVERMGEAYLHLIEEARRGTYPLPCPRSELPPVDPNLYPWGPTARAFERWTRRHRPATDQRPS